MCIDDQRETLQGDLVRALKAYSKADAHEASRDSDLHYNKAPVIYIYIHVCV